MTAEEFYSGMNEHKERPLIDLQKEDKITVKFFENTKKELVYKLLKE